MKLHLERLRDWVLIKKLIKYSIGWGLGAGVNVFFLRFFTDVVGIYYIVSAVLAFLISGISWFFFQKYFTFRNVSKKHTKQLFLFIVFQWIWLLIDLLLLRLLVDKMGIYYIYVSIFNKAVIFVWNFVMNHFFTFYRNE